MASPEEMAAKMVANLLEKTGKDMAAWLKIVKASGLEKHGEIVKMLKGDHGMTHGFANLVAHESRGSAAAHSDDADLISAQYAGPKADLVPIREAVLACVKGFGKDVEIAPKKAYVSLRRSKQFAILQPSTKTRVDLGLNLGDHPVTDRLEASGSFNSMVSHRVRVSDASDVDAGVKAWIRKAYDGA